VREGGKEAASVSLGDLGRDLSPHPFVLCFAQDDHERFLVDRLHEAGVAIEWNTELTEVDRRGDDSVTAVIKREHGVEMVTTRYLCGCDGAHSKVRHSIGVDFEGGSYDQLFYVADVELAEDTPQDLFMNLAEGGFVLMLPVRSSGMRRFIGTIPSALQAVEFKDIEPFIEATLGHKTARLNWFSTYRVHHRVASHFCHGRVFIAGDAAHIHSPAGGQGMNTGIGDAVNLSWKLAHVLQGRLHPSALATYEPERIAFARKLVESTDRAFHGLVSPGIGGKLLRTWLVPTVAPLVTELAVTRRLIFKTLSQTRINYRSSYFSEGKVRDVQGGDRLPWVPGDDEGDADARLGNYAPLRSLDWQCHVYGTARHELRSALAALGVALHNFPWSPAAAHAGLKEDATYLVRPDGHVALAMLDQDVEDLGQYADRIGLN
jgi:2-polyprenyl-6-methoxyphenol hydroxylase-like FAD-dependent oxidoreductase